MIFFLAWFVLTVFLMVLIVINILFESEFCGIKDFLEYFFFIVKISFIINYLFIINKLDWMLDI